MGKTAAEAGWHKSRYNIFAQVPGSSKYVIVNLFKGTCSGYTIPELFLLDQVETLDENHPILERFAQRGLIVNFDELSVLESYGRITCGRGNKVDFTICPTMGCNFDCPYCFEKHTSGLMTSEVQNDIILLARRMLEAARPRFLQVTWFGGEPLLGPEIIEPVSGKLMALADEYNAEYTANIITNGYLLTQDIVDMLWKCKVKEAKITLDGIGVEHDKTRHLAGGGATFDKITQNLQTLKIPFRVKVRHNVHSGNYDQIEPLREFIENLSGESGNDIRYHCTPVRENDAMESRNSGVDKLCGSDYSKIEMRLNTENFKAGRGIFCGASHFFTIAVDEKGRLHKCWEDVDKPEHSFANAAEWDPKDPFITADHPENLTSYLSTALPVEDSECRECIWLPSCVGGCPNKRLYYKRECVSYKNDPEQYALSLYERYEKMLKASNRS